MSKLITIEGIDGAGKTTISRELSLQLGERAFFIEKKSTDADTLFRQQFMSEVKPILWGRSPSEPVHEVDEEAWLYLHMLWYYMVQEYVISPKLEKYDYVIMDGWYYKFLARHIVNNKMDDTFAKHLISRRIAGDRVFILDVAPDICFERKGDVMPSECGAHKNENISSLKESFCKYQKSVYDAYVSIDNNNFDYVDAHGSVDDIVLKIKKRLRHD